MSRYGKFTHWTEIAIGGSDVYVRENFLCKELKPVGEMTSIGGWILRDPIENFS